MRVHFFQHVPFEGLGSIERWIDAHGYHLTATQMYSHETMPCMESIDWLIVLGGPMGVHDEAKFPWLTGEKRFIEMAINNGKVVLGICLGAQLIADVLGARVHINRFREIGWYPIKLTSAGKSSPLFGFLPDRMEVFHWHGDTFDLPSGAVHIARSEACAHQAFVHGDKVVGLQFHLESTREGVDVLIRNCEDELTDGKYIQTPSRLLAPPQSFAVINRAMDELLSRIEQTDKKSPS
ncbi:MAG TPA: type 1 glutamine amidotransferase [Syntrophales bacterium]|nr:type 1 glutamine amidotransferase [Syntrophales bacterium]